MYDNKSYYASEKNSIMYWNKVYYVLEQILSRATCLVGKKTSTVASRVYPWLLRKTAIISNGGGGETSVYYDILACYK